MVLDMSKKLRRSGGAPSQCQRATVAELPLHLFGGWRLTELPAPCFWSTDRQGTHTGLMYDDLRAQNEARHANEAGGAVWASLGYRMQPCGPSEAALVAETSIAA